VAKLEKQLTKEQLETLKKKTGLRLSTYFSALKLKWLLNNNEDVQNACKENRCMFGTVDSWLMWKLSGHKSHVTDITNASRTLLCNIQTGQWDPELLQLLEIPKEIILPQIRSCSEHFIDIADGKFAGIPITGCLGDQQAALVGNQCLDPGQAKATYGTGCFLLFNIGNSIKYSSCGLLTTVGFQFGSKSDIVYALEGSISSAGSAITWMKDKMELIRSPAELSSEASKVNDTKGVYFVPAFKGLFAPRWRSDARGIIVGLTGNQTKAHLCRAVLEAVGYQVKEIFDAMHKDCSEISIDSLKVDGGMTASTVFLQVQADILGVKVVRPKFNESTVLGAAFAAGLHLGVYKHCNYLNDDQHCSEFEPTITEETRQKNYEGWNRAVEASCSFATANKL